MGLLCTPVDVLYCCLLCVLVDLGRESAVEEDGGRCTGCMELLYFLSDHWSFQDGWKDFQSLDSFLVGGFGGYFSGTGVGGREDMEDRLQSKFRFASIDAFIDFMDCMIELTFNQADAPTNCLSGPIMVSKESALGIALRKTLVKWRGMGLEQCGDLYHTIIEFTQGVRGGGHYGNLGNESSNNGKSTRINKSSADNLTDSIKQAIERKDYSLAVDHVHRYYDIGMHNPIVNPRTLPPAALLSSSGPNPFKRHQEAMLVLGGTWLSGEQFQLALTAVEEGLKTAHQRDDHESIACSLLLLYRVMMQNHALNVNKGKLLGDEALMRCLMRCLALSLDSLSTEAALCLAQVRCLTPLTPAPRVVLSLPSVDESMLGSLADSSQSVWMLLAACQMRLMRIVHALVSPGAALPAIPGQGTKRLLRIIAESDLWAGDTGPSLRVFHISAQLWIRLGQMNMAVQACLRGIASWNGAGELSDLVCLSCLLSNLLVQMHVDGTVSVDGGSDGTVNKIPCSQIVAFLQQVQSSYQARLSHDLDSELSVALHKVLAHDAMSNDRLEDAKRYIATAIELSFGGEKKGNPRSIIRLQLLQVEVLWRSGYNTAAYEQAAGIVAAAGSAGFVEEEGLALLLQARVQRDSRTASSQVEYLATDAFFPVLTGVARLDALRTKA